MTQEENQRTLVMETANRVALETLSSVTGLEALRHIAEAARTLAAARYGALGVARTDGAGLSAFVTVGLTGEEEAAIGPRPTGRGVLGLLLERDTPLRIDALCAHSDSVGFPPNHPPMDSFLGIPIRRGETTLGSLYLTNKDGGGPFTEADEAAVQTLGAYAAVAIHNFHLLSRQRALVHGLMTAQEEERRAIAYDLHDGLTQFVMAAHMHLEAFQRARDAGRLEKAERDLEHGLQYLKEATLESRRMINGLRPLALDDLGLAGAVELLLHEEKTRANWTDAEFAHNVSSQRFDRTIETAAYRVAQEALTNARKHAEASRVRVLLLVGDGETRGESPTLTLEVRDWGRGFSPSEADGDSERVGLHSMAERVQLTGGAYSLRSAPGDGTTVRAVFPALPPPAEDARKEERA